MLKDSDEYVQETALEVFKKFGSSDDLPFVREMIEDGNNVRIAFEVLKKFGSSDDFQFVRDMQKYKYLFSWDDISGNDSERLLRCIRFVSGKLGIERTGNAEILKSDDGKTIYIFTDENSAEIIIDEKNEKATLKISDSRPCDLKVKKENGELKVYIHRNYMNSKEDHDLERAYLDLILFHGELLKDDDENVREVAQLAIEAPQIRNDITFARERLKDGACDKSALNTLKKLGNSEDLPLIRKVLKNTFNSWKMCDDYEYEEMRDVYTMAYETFEALVSREDFSIVQDMLKNGDVGEYMAATEAFKKIGSRDDLPLIREMLNEGGGGMRMAAIEILGEFGTEDDLTLLIGNALDPGKDVALAMETLISIDKRLYYPYNPSKIY